MMKSRLRDVSVSVFTTTVMAVVGLGIRAGQAQQLPGTGQPTPTTPANPASDPCVNAPAPGGTLTYIPIWIPPQPPPGCDHLGNSVMNQLGGNVGVSTPIPRYKLDVNGDINLGSRSLGSVIRWLGQPIVSLPGGGDSGNIALGLGAAHAITTGVSNTATGAFALSANTAGSNNTATGYQALQNNTSGTANTASGSFALQLNTDGGANTAIGFEALQHNDGGANTAIGYGAPFSNITGSANTAVGGGALAANTMGQSNTATGVNALQFNTMGGGNTAIGGAAMESNTMGGSNTVLGFEALGLNTTGNGNIAIGFQAANALSGANSNNIEIGSRGSSTDSGTIRIGGNTALGDPVAQTSFFVAGVATVNLAGDANATQVFIDTSTGQLGIKLSSRRYKEDIQDMGESSRGLMRLRPVTFRYKKPFDDGSKPIQYGLIAEEVAEVYPDLVARSADGQIETVKYDVLDSMLLNEVQRQQAEIAAQKDRIRALEQQIGQQSERTAKLESALASMSAPSRVP
jgi:hypothetical protein